MDWKTGLEPVLALTFIPGIGSVMLRQLVAYTGNPEEALHASRKNLNKIPGIGPGLIQNLEQHRSEALDRAREEIANLEKLEGFGIHFLHPDYPQRLKTIPDGPTVLFCRGNFHFQARRTLSIVGTRQASPYGKQAIEDFLQELLPYQPVIVSGLAYGIDITAHKAALKAGLETWGIMATGIDQVYPGTHASTALQMQSHGGVLTENLLHTKPDAPRFPARNRIIAGLADAVWVVEAMEKGGALITAHLANDYFRDVFALPGPRNQRSSAGCHQLIRQNLAALVASGKDLAEAMGWNDEKPAHLQPANWADLPETDRKVLEIFQRFGDQHLDEVAWKTQVPIPQLASLLLNLEFQGLVCSHPGKRFGLRDAAKR